MKDTLNCDNIEKNLLKSSSENEDDSNANETRNYRYGFGKWRPQFLQVLNNNMFLLINLCIMGTLQGMVINGLVSISISTLEKKYGFNSTMTGIMVAIYDVTIVIIIIPVSFYLSKLHKIKILAISMIVMGMGSIIFTLPQIIWSENVNSIEISKKLFCSNVTRSDDITQKTNYYAYIIFVVAQIIHGIGCSTMYIFSYIVIDENAKPRMSSIYIGIFYGFSVLGPPLGFLLGGVLLNVRGNFYEQIVDVVAGDVNWYGAWYLGFLIAAVLLFISSIPLFGFDSHLPYYEKIKVMQYADAYGDESLTTLRHISFGSLSKLPAIIWKLLNNLPFMFVVISTTFDSFLMNGFVTFIPKIMETQFTLSPSGASLYSGCVIIPAGFFGTVISGYIIKNMSNLKKIGFAAAVFCISIPFVFIFLLNCSTVPVVGMQRGYDYKPGIEVKGPVTIYDECNNNCNCPKPRGEYICRLNVQSEDPLLAYPSLCWAGCSNITDTKIECTCLKANSTILSRDQCENLLECYNLYIFLLGLSVIVFLTFMASTPLIHVIIRVVPYTQRSIALGLSWLFARTFGTIPGPIFFGWLIDMSCLSFSDSSICLYYDNNMMKKMILAISIIIRSISFITLCIACLVYKL